MNSSIFEGDSLEEGVLLDQQDETDKEEDTEPHPTSPFSQANHLQTALSTSQLANLDPVSHESNDS